MPIFNGGAKSVDGDQVLYGPNNPRFRIPKYNWKLLLARFKYYGWLVFTKLVLGVVYLSIVADGLKYIIPSLGMKLSKVPLFGFLDGYQLTYRHDLASAMALFVLLAVFWLWDQALTLWIIGKDTKYVSDDPLFRVRRESSIYSLAIVVLSMDAILFFIALVQSNWDGSVFSFTALIATILYSSVLIFVTLVTIELRQKLSNVEGESSEKTV